MSVARTWRLQLSRSVLHRFRTSLGKPVPGQNPCLQWKPKAAVSVAKVPDQPEEALVVALPIAECWS